MTDTASAPSPPPPADARVRWRRKLREWIGRYGPPEIVGTITALGASFLVFHLTHSEVAAAFGASLAESCGFYSILIFREFLADRRRARHAGQPYNHRGVTVTLAKLIFEFGPAELLDTFLFRPLAIGLATHYLGRTVGVITGKLLGDVTFYLPVIISYELRKTFAKRRSESQTEKRA